MTYNLYIDVLFFVNFLMDFLLLAALRRVLKYRKNTVRIILAAGAGAFWASAVTAFPILPLGLEKLITYLLVGAIMVKIAYGVRGIRETLRAMAGLYLTAVVMGGAIDTLYQHTRAGYYIELLLKGRGSEAMPLYILLLFATGIYFGIKFFIPYLMKMKTETDNLYQVTLYYRGRAQTVTALMDTGNRLYEPVTRKPVHVVTYEAVRQLCETVSSVVFIPFCSVGKETGMMPGIFFDEMEVRQGERTMVYSRPLVAVSKTPLSPDGTYQMLLHNE